MTWWLLGGARAIRTLTLGNVAILTLDAWLSWGTSGGYVRAATACASLGLGLWMTWELIPGLRQRCVLAIIIARRMRRFQD